MGLLTLARVFRNEDKDGERLTQAVSIAPEKLAKLAPESVVELNRQGALPLAYAQIQSLENMGRLYRASQASVDGPETELNTEPGKTRSSRQYAQRPNQSPPWSDPSPA